MSKLEDLCPVVLDLSKASRKERSRGGSMYLALLYSSPPQPDNLSSKGLGGEYRGGFLAGDLLGGLLV